MRTERTWSELFDDEMMDVYSRADQECNHDATLFRQMIGPGRGMNSAKTLLKASRVQSCFENFCFEGLLDITMKARMLKPKDADYSIERN